MYKKFSSEEYYKSLNYIARLYSNQVKSGNIPYSSSKKCVSLNFVTGNFRKCNNQIVNVHVQKHNTTNVIMDKNGIEFVIVRLDNIENKKYNVNEKKFIKWLKFLKAKSMDELKQIARGSEIMEQSVAYLENFYAQGLNRTFNDYVAEKTFASKSEGIAIGKSEGIAIGKSEGILNTAKNMLLKGYKAKEIADITNLSIKEIQKLKNELGM